MEICAVEWLSYFVTMTMHGPHSLWRQGTEGRPKNRYNSRKSSGVLPAPNPFNKTYFTEHTLFNSYILFFISAGKKLKLEYSHTSGGHEAVCRI